MAAGISVFLHDEHTLRQAPDAFIDALSNYFSWENDEELLGFGTLLWPKVEIEEEPEPIYLSDLLL